MTVTTNPADQHDVIVVQGGRENNLQNVNVTIPKRRLTTFTGVSGSGKSSLVFDTIAAESQRLINETYSAFLQGMMPSIGRPNVDLLEGITTAIVVDQERMGANPRSTVGTATDAGALLRVLYSRLATPPIGGPKAYSFNIPSSEGSGVLKKQDGTREVASFRVVGGMCPKCEGTGRVNDFDWTQLYDESLSLHGGALKIPGYTADGWNVRIFAESGMLDPDKPIKDYSKRELRDFLYKKATKIRIEKMNLTYEGLIPRLQRSILSKDPEAMQPHIRAFVDRAVIFTTCPECKGSRLNEGARSSLINGLHIGQACDLEVADLAVWIRQITDPSVAPLVKALADNLDSMADIGLGYLSLSRPTGTLSGGESQRVKMVRHLGSALTDVTYIFDEPTLGLHPHDVARMNDLLVALRDKGNTVLVVEHKPESIAISDHVVDLGPGAGPAGGQVCFEGSVEELRTSDTLTGRHFNDRVALKTEARTPTGSIEIRGASQNNLRNVDVDVPLGVLTVVTGVAGSGKSSLIERNLPKDLDLAVLDQSPIKGSIRSNPATYTGMLDPIRKAFAKANGVKPGLFSANSEGACPNCKGLGVVITQLGFMDTVSTMCDLCDGRRFQESVLEYRLGEKNIADVFQMSVADALAFFSGKANKVAGAHKILQRLSDVGLGYLTLGQPLSTLSGGERQRLRLAVALAGDQSVFVLDEPTAGLHPADISTLLDLFDDLVEDGKSLIVIEHQLAVMSRADHLIDMGPGAGTDGGNVVFQGTPGQMIEDASTVTGEYLARYQTEG